MEAIEYIETAQAIMMLAYHDKNYLSRALTGSPKKFNETIRELLDLAADKL